jgi:hypothetical protein
MLDDGHLRFRGDAANQPFADWYSAELSEGAHTLSFSEVVATQRLDIEIRNPAWRADR